MYDVTFTYVDEIGTINKVTITSNLKKYQSNVNKAKNYCKDKEIFLEIISIK